MSEIPSSNILPKPRRRLFLLLLMFPVCFAFFIILIQFIFPQGIIISISFSDAHQIKAGDILKCRGVAIGEVISVTPNTALTGVNFKVQLIPEANAVAREGSQFWIVRPEVSMYGIKGLDTVVGAEYIGVIPGDGAPQNSFVGLEMAPGLEKSVKSPIGIVLSGSRRGGLNPGMPVTYRNVQIGVISKVDLLRDASGLKVACAIDSKYKPLLAGNASFYNTCGMGLDIGLKGINVAMDSLRSIAMGGIALTIPDEPEVPVESGHNFTLSDYPPKGSEDWDPMIDLDADAGFSLSDIPSGIDAVASSTSFFGSDGEEIIGLGIPLNGGFLFPMALKDISGAKFRSHHSMTQFGDIFPDRAFDDLAYRKMTTTASFTEWPKERIGDIPPHEDLYAFRNCRFQPRLISKEFISSQAVTHKFLILQKTFPKQWNGAAVISKTGYLAGILINRDKKWEIVAIPRELRNK
ncbi:MAG: MCE family protein [Candidatus Riflebacteria bacterium]|nr:MCE family protein [Candidatus Riflebacteria bacterium]